MSHTLFSIALELTTALYHHSINDQSQGNWCFTVQETNLLILQVGAHFLETVVRKFDEVYKNPAEGKECDNLIAIIGHLYNFQVVHSVIIFDILKLLIGAFTEKDVELVLFVLRNVGFALRKDDALALKDLISEGQRKASNVGPKFQDQTRVGETALHIYISVTK